MKTAFLITAFDQTREVRFMRHIIRERWRTHKDSPIVVVISGDRDRIMHFNEDPLTRVVHIDDMVGDKFKTLVSTSIMRQITHGMLEVKDLERQYGRIENVVHMHGDILLLNERGFNDELLRWKGTGKPLAGDNVGAQNPVVKEIDGKEWKWRFYGSELMPQLFAVDHDFCKFTGYMYDMEVIGDLEAKATEWALIGNLHRALCSPGDGHALIPHINPLQDSESPYRFVFDEHVHVVKRNRAQWGLHKHWGGFCHFGNSIHYTKSDRETRNELALKQYGINLEKW